MIKIQFAEIAAIVAPILSSALTWVILRKKNSAELRKTVMEADGIELKNLHLATKIWKDMVRDLQIEVTQLRGQVNKLSSQLFEFSQENAQLKNEIKSMHELFYKKPFGEDQNL